MRGSALRSAPKQGGSSKAVLVLICIAVVSFVVVLYHFPWLDVVKIADPLRPVPVDAVVPQEGYFDVFANLAPHVTLTIYDQGDGRTVGKYAKVSVHYTGKFTNGTVFDSSEGRDPLTFTTGLRQVIRGWDDTIQLFRVGTHAEIVIAPEWAYGSKGFGNTIPPNSILVFEIKVVDATGP